MTKKTKLKNKLISVIVPLYNEEENIAELITRLTNSLIPLKRSFELIMIDDNSTDNTKQNIKKYKSENVIYLKKQGKQGKAYSLIEGFKKSKGGIVVMIDADLQYAPEEIPAMIKALSNADIVVANRKHYQDAFLRKVLSYTFRTFFGKGLFGLKHDIQSGLKVFKRETIDVVCFIPSSKWSFDLEFLHRSHLAGFKIINFDIFFKKRKNGKSNINFLKTTFDIGFNALKLRLKQIHPISTKPKKRNTMLGAGIRYKNRHYITHTTLPHKASAIYTFTLSQKTLILFIVCVFGLGIFIKPLITLQILVGMLSFIYFSDSCFNLFVIFKSLSFPQEIVSSDEEILNLIDTDLPAYSILCPLYCEAHVVPQFMNAMNKLDWPKEKLDVLLLLEEDDRETIEAVRKMDLPNFARIINVPHSVPKTKPKACNYGLGYTKGKYLVIYDAEDIPEPKQLKKAFLAFKKVNDKTICLQAKLNYYNPHQNLLTRFFTAEYSLWFDVILTGLQSINTVIPLGGTSNHFITSALKEIEGWDPFNVTEDADLGMRLFKKGYQTAIIDSVTLEEANSRLGNWLRQRSRWIKGYMQTYLVHTREALTLIKERGGHSLIFQLIIGGKIAFILINPFLWLATFSYFALYRYVGVQIESVYPSYVFYMALFSLVFGNFLFLYYYMIGIAKKGQWNLMKFVFLIPIYWVMLSISAFMAFYQLIFKPHYWEKTIHGFHLLNKKDLLVKTVIQSEEKSFSIAFPKFYIPNFRFLTQKSHFALGSLIIANALSNVFAFGFSAYLGRVLSFEDFALVGLINGLISVSGIIFGSLGTTVTQKTGHLIGKAKEKEAIAFWAETRKKAFIISALSAVLWIVSAPFLFSYFNLSATTPLLIFSPVILISLMAASDIGLLFSRFNFKAISILTVSAQLIKFLIAVLLVYFGLKSWAYIAIPISVIITFFMGWKFVYKNKEKIKDYALINYKFPSKFFVVSLSSGLSTIIFLNLDVILAKHYLSAEDAGIYTLTALIGKMIYFLGVLASPFTIPFVSRNEGANKDSKRFLNLTVLATLFLVLPAFGLIVLFGRYIIPFMFGQKAIVTLPFLTIVSLSMVFFSISRVFTDYYLAKKYYSFALCAFILGIFQIILLGFFHQSITSFINVMCVIWISNLLITLSLHLYADQVKIIENRAGNFLQLYANLKDLAGLFKRLKIPEAKQDKSRILIFNWRDIKHRWAGGSEVYIHELAKVWIKKGYSVTLFSGNDSKLPTRETIDGLKIYRRGGFYMVYVWALFYYLVKFRGKYDVIIDCENGIPFFTPLYAKEKKFLLIHHVHQEVFRKSLRWPFSLIAGFLEAKLMPFVYRNVEVVTVSPSSKKEIIRHKLTKKDPVIIYNGVNLETFKPGEKSENPMILCLGRLQYYKSLNVLIVAAKLILKNISTARFVIAGEGGEKEKLKKLAQKLGISESIDFLGKVSEEEKISLFQKAWVFVNPSLMEGWGITTIEANACGTPAVASNVPGLRDSIKNPHTGFLVEYGNYEGFAKNIEKLITDKKLRKKMSQEAVMWAKNFSWEKSADEFSKSLNK